MTAAANIALKEQRRTSLALLLPILLGLTFVRLIGLRFSVVDLFYDEAQYWAWSRDLAFGYSSKPPFLAWIIAVAETVCGSSEACIRAPAPVLYFGTCLATYGVAKVLYDERTAFWAALLVVLAPGAIFSARIISTDVPLMFCWALALLFYLKLLGTSRLGWGIMFGLAFGLGLLAKYAMIYFLLGVALAAIFDPDARALLRKPALWLGFAIAAAIVAPNILWNAEHRFVTFVRVGENVKGEGFGFDPLQMPAFLLAQFAVIGPIAFMVLIFAFVRMRSSTLPRADRLRLAQTLGARTLAAERRGDTAALAYYWRDRPERVLEWPLPETPEFDLTSGLNENAAEPILLITDCPFPARLQSFYSTVEAVGRIDTVAGPTSTRSFAVFLLSGHRGPIRPLAPCESGVFPPQFLQPIVLPSASTDGREGHSSER